MSLVKHLAVDMGVLVSKMEESIEARIQASLITARILLEAFPEYPSGKSWDEVLGKTGSGKKFHRNVPTLSEQQHVDSDTVDPGGNGELMDNAFVFAKKRTPCARRPVTVTLVSQPRALARLPIATLSSLRIQGRVFRKQANSNDDSGTAMCVYRH